MLDVPSRLKSGGALWREPLGRVGPRGGCAGCSGLRAVTLICCHVDHLVTGLLVPPGGKVTAFPSAVSEHVAPRCLKAWDLRACCSSPGAGPAAAAVPAGSGGGVATPGEGLFPPPV